MNDLCFFVSDLHGKASRYEALFRQIELQNPGFVLMGGDLLPSWASLRGDFLNDVFLAALRGLKADMAGRFPRFLVILGNDDPRVEESTLMQGEEEGLLHYMHMRKLAFEGYTFYGCAWVPPTPFLLKDWERYDVGVYVDPGCVHPTEGFRSLQIHEDIRYTNIGAELNRLTQADDLSKAVFLFHSPPYKTNLDRAALDGKMIDYVPLDVNVGSIAIRRFIEDRQPLLTLHGHIHESSRLTGSWRDTLGISQCFNASHDGPELSLISFQLSNLPNARRNLY